jgi:hypothetical protein
MGKGIDLARPFAPEHAAALDDFKDQLLLVLLRRLGALDKTLSIPVEEIDDTGGLVCNMSIVDRVFNFSLGRKQ